MKTKRIITRQEVNCIIKKYRINIGTYTIRENDDLIDVNGDVKICNKELTRLPLKFGNVYGDFLCHSKLTSLRGSPTYVAGDFNCYGNQLTSLKHGPAQVGGDYTCPENVLTSLKGSPTIINGNFNCFLNQLKSLSHGPIKVNGSYYAYHNELVTLEGSPDFVGGSFNVGSNEFSNLVGCPKVIGGIFSFDETVTSLYMGKNCIVHRVEIQKQEGLSKVYNTIPQVVIGYKKLLPILFKYAGTLSIWDANGNFCELDFNDIIMDIKEGLR
jgi:hypothetical protein